MQFREITLLHTRTAHRDIAFVCLNQIINSTVRLKSFYLIIRYTGIQVPTRRQFPLRSQLIDKQQVVVRLLTTHEALVGIRRLIIGIHTQIIAHRLTRGMYHHEVILYVVFVVVPVTQICHHNLRCLYV